MCVPLFGSHNAGTSASINIASLPDFFKNRAEGSLGLISSFCQEFGFNIFMVIEVL